MAGGRTRLALLCAVAYSLAALVAGALAAWLSPLLPAAGRWVGAAIFTLVTAVAAAGLGARYACAGDPRGIPLRIALYAVLGTALVWGYGYAWLVDPTVTRISILGPLVGLVRGLRFALAHLLSSAPLLIPGWWAAHRLAERGAARITA